MGLLADGFQRRAKLTIPAAQVGSGGVSNYSIVLTDACIGGSHSFWSEVQSNGGDLRASTDVSGNTRLALDIIHLDTSAKTCEINVGQVSLSAVSVNEFYLWWKHGTTQSQPAVGAAFGQYATYRSSLVGFWPFQLSSANDRTSFQNHGTHVSAVAGQPGQPGQSVLFNGSSYISIPHSSSINFAVGSNITILGTVYKTSSGQTHICGKRTACGGGSLPYQIHDYGGFMGGGTNLTLNTWCHIASSTGVGSFINAANVGGGVSVNLQDTADFHIGRSGSCNGFVGREDSMRLFGEALSLAYITTDYNNSNSPGTFATLAAADSLGSISNRRGIRTGGNLTAGGILIGGRL